MRIGISVHTRRGQSLWDNGVGQNVYHLASLLSVLPFVERVVLLDCGGQAAVPSGAGRLGEKFTLVSMTEAIDLIDVAIEMTGVLDRSWIDCFRARGGRVVLHSCVSLHATLVERALFAGTANASLANAGGYDEVWTLARDRQFERMIRGFHRCPAVEVPYLWSPVFLEENARSAPSGSFGYRAGSLSGRTAIPVIFEPNTSPRKMGTIPLLICEAVGRQDPKLLGQVGLYNGARLLRSLGFAGLVAQLDLFRSGKLAIYHRDYFAHVMARGANIVVSHQVDAAQNYLYFDALAGGYPLVHNSPLFAQVGYYYPFCDIEAGVAALVRACRDHDRTLDHYRRRAAALIAAHSPDDRANRDRYARRLLALGTASVSRRAA